MLLPASTGSNATTTTTEKKNKSIAVVGRPRTGCLQLKGKNYRAVLTVTGPDGKSKRQFIALHTSDRAEAEHLLEGYVAASKGKTVEARKTYLNAIIAQEEALPIDVVDRVYEEKHGKWKTEDRRRLCLGRIQRFERWAAANKLTDMRQVTDVIARRYLASLDAAGLAGNTVCQHGTVLADAWAVVAPAQFDGGKNPWRGLRSRCRAEEVPKEVLTDAQMAAVLKAARNEGDDVYAAFVIAAHTGLREGDVMRLTFADIDSKTRTLSIVPHKTKDSSHMRVTVPVDNELWHVIRECGRRVVEAGEPTDGYVLPRLARMYLGVDFNDHDPLRREARGRRMVSRLICRVFRRSGIETKAPGRGSRRATIYSFHSLRHGYVSKLIAAGLSTEIVQAAVGHSSEAMRERYTHLTMAGVERIREAMGIRLAEPANRNFRDVIAEDRAARQAAEDARAITVEAVESDGDSDAKAVARMDNADDAAVLAQIAKLASALSPETRAKLAGMLAK